jgi:hypothetical protein
MTVGAHYTAGEVLFLLSLARKEALKCDSAPPDSLARFVSGRNEGAGSASTAGGST